MLALRYLVKIYVQPVAFKDGLRHLLLYYFGFLRAVSSAGRAPRLHRGGRRFETVTAHQTNMSCRRETAQYRLVKCYIVVF